MDEACAAVRIRAEREGERPVLSRKEIARVVAQASGVGRTGGRKGGSGWPASKSA
ncbi:MAG: hypothetical protein ACLVA8_07065 [Faecalibacterium prausnitzii]